MLLSETCERKREERRGEMGEGEERRGEERRGRERVCVRGSACESSDGKGRETQTDSRAMEKGRKLIKTS